MSCLYQTENGTRFVSYPDGSMQMLPPGHKDYNKCSVDPESFTTSPTMREILTEMSVSSNESEGKPEKKAEEKTEKKPAAKSKRGTLYVPEATALDSKPTVSTATKSFSDIVRGRPAGAGANPTSRIFDATARKLGERHPALDIVIKGKVVNTAQIINVPSAGNNCAIFSLGDSIGKKLLPSAVRGVVAGSIDFMEDDHVLGKCFTPTNKEENFAKGLTKNPDYAKLRERLKKHMLGSGHLDYADIFYLQVYYECCVVVGALYEKNGSHYIQIVDFQPLDENDGTAVLLVNTLKKDHWMYALVDGERRSETIYKLGVNHKDR